MKEHDTELEVVDVSENTCEAENFEIKNTTTVLIEKSDEIVERYEVVSYLDGILERDELESVLDES